MKKGDILKANSLKGYSVIIFMAITNIFYCDFVGFNYLIDNYKQNAWIMILFLFIINIIICLPFKGFKKSFSPLKEIKNNSMNELVDISMKELSKWVDSLPINSYSQILDNNKEIIIKI